MLLPLELYFKIIDACIYEDILACKDILNSDSNQITTTRQLALVNHCTNNYIIQNADFHRLRLWKLLLHIPKGPIQLAIGNTHQWTLVYIDIHTQYMDTQEEHFIVINERMKRHCEPSKWTKQSSMLYLQSTSTSTTPNAMTHKQQDTRIPFFDLYGFLIDLYAFTTNNIMSIWLWKRANTFFKSDILNHEFSNKEQKQHRSSTQTNSESYVTHHGFRPVLDTQQKSLMAWDRPTTFNKKGLTETVMLYNTELFGTMLWFYSFWCIYKYSFCFTPLFLFLYHLNKLLYHSNVCHHLHDS